MGNFKGNTKKIISAKKLAEEMKNINIDEMVDEMNIPEEMIRSAFEDSEFKQRHLHICCNGTSNHEQKARRKKGEPKVSRESGNHIYDEMRNKSLSELRKLFFEKDMFSAEGKTVFQRIDKLLSKEIQRAKEFRALKSLYLLSFSSTQTQDQILRKIARLFFKKAPVATT